MTPKHRGAYPGEQQGANAGDHLWVAQLLRIAEYLDAEAIAADRVFVDCSECGGESGESIGELLRVSCDLSKTCADCAKTLLVPAQELAKVGEGKGVAQFRCALASGHEVG